jgi:uncharacterized protein YcaQ
LPFGAHGKEGSRFESARGFPDPVRIASCPVKVTAEAARRFLVAHHLLAPARSLEGGPDAVLEVFRRFGSIQFDPLAVAGRNHDLVLHARVADYDPAWCDLLYERREVFEAYNKGLSLVPTSEFPWFRGTWSQNSSRILAENREVAERVLERVRAEGPLSALDFERERGSTIDWFGAPTCSRRTQSPVRSASRDVTATAATTTSSSGCCRTTCSSASSR